LPPEGTLFSHELKPVRAGDLILVQGANGSGKTTLLREWSSHSGLPWLPTSPDRRLLGMTIEEELNLQHPTLFAQHLAGSDATIPDAETIQLQQSALRLDLGLSHLSMVTPVHDLSTGERRRLSLLPLLMRKPQIMLLDEIDHGLDDQTLADLIEQLNGHRKAGCAIVITSHSPDLVAWAKVSGGRVWNIAQGQVMEVSS
jgi:ABC-type multidrug transport system ATPase subunit